MSAFRLATRRSPLALLQAEFVRTALAMHGVESELVLIETSGDKKLDVPLSVLGGQGVFAVEIQVALLRGEADAAVHSAKDLPSQCPDGLEISCVPERRDAADALVGRSLAGLGPGATVATGSPRRRALLLERRPDLRVVELRGNMAKRLSTPGSEGVDAIIAASAALERLGELDRVAERLDPSWFVPQVGQGAIAVESRVDDEKTRAALASINNVDAMTALRAERAFLRELGAGCSIPAGAFARVDARVIELHAVMVGIDGSRSVRSTLLGDHPEQLGQELAIELRDELGGDGLPGWDRS